MSKQRVELLSPEAAREAAESVGVHEAVARLNVFRALLHRPQTARAISDLLFSLLFHAKLEHRLRELVIMRIGWATGADYEWTQHWPLSQEMYGCAAEEVLAVRDWRNATCLDEPARAVLAATDELLDTGSLSDEAWERCHALLGCDACIDLVAAVGTWSLISNLARGLRVPLEDGVASWPPDALPSPAEALGRLRGIGR